MRSLAPSGVARLAAVLTLGGFYLAGCSSDNSTSMTASLVAALSGDAQSATVATNLSAPVVAQVKDQDGNAMSGVLVTFTATGGATLDHTTATTDASGEATTTVTLGTAAGPGTVTAMAAGVSTPAVFTFTANAGAPSALVVVSGNNQSGTAGSPLANPLVVKATDQYGNTTSGATIDWTTTAGAFAGTTQSTTTSTGTAAAALELPSVAGVVVATATLRGTLATAIFTETAM